MVNAFVANFDIDNFDPSIMAVITSVVGVTCGTNGERCIIVTFNTGAVVVSWEDMHSTEYEEHAYTKDTLPREVAELRELAWAHDSRVANTATGRLCVLGPSVKTHRRDLIVREYASEAELDAACAQWYDRIMREIS